MKKSIELLCETANISKAVSFVSEFLSAEKADKRERVASLLKLENALVAVIEKSDPAKDRFTVQISRAFSQIRISVVCRGEAVSVQEIIPDMGLDGLDTEVENVLKSRMMPLLSENIKVRNRYGVNRVSIGVSKRKMNRIVFIVLCMMLGITVGLLLKAVFPGNVSGFIAKEILGTVITIFFNLLKMIVAPLVFFSIISGISGFQDMSALGRISLRSILYFVGFSIVGLCIGVGVFTLFPVGDPSILKLVSINAGQVSATVTAWDSFKNLILSIFPSNLLGAFVNNEVLAVILLAVLFGMCIGKMQPDYAGTLIRVANILNDLMCRLAAMIVRAMPLIIFCSMAKMMITVEFASVLVLLKLLGTFLIGILIMFGVYIVILAVNGISPAAFFKGFAPALLSAVTLASSSATMPVSLKCCTESLKIPPMISYFVIPLGSTINMNGSCIVQTLICLFTAKVFNVELTLSILLPVLCMILLLSMAAPGVPGSNIIMIASILPMMGIPSEAAQLTICIAAFVGMMLVPANSTGDAIVAMLIHKGESRKAKK